MLLRERDRQKKARLELERHRTLRELDHALRELLPGERVIVFGSVLHPGLFRRRSDVDLALLREPTKCTLYGLTAELSERLRRPVDVVLLDECRFRDKIKREGELWTL